EIVTREELEALVPGAFPLSRPIGPGRLPSPPQSFAIGDKMTSYQTTCGCPRTFAARWEAWSASRRCILSQMPPVTPCKPQWSPPTTYASDHVTCGQIAARMP